jgi:undecaprenyl diphosphate synthase
LFNSLKKYFFKPKKVPKHIAVIMDGNGRWAKKRVLPRIAGLSQGLQSAQTIVKLSVQHKIKYLTLFTFSTENWDRPAEEVKGLLKLIDESVTKASDQIFNNNIVIRFLGDNKVFPKNLQKQLNNLEKKCAKNNGLVLNIALNYGGRAEIVRAVNRLIKANQKRVSEKNIADNLDTAGMPNVDLLIRTGGEKRISNFLLWQIAYAELFFIDTLWPDFSEKHFIEALDWYQKRQRKFGGLVDNTHA